MANEDFKWFPLDRLDVLETAIAEMVADPKTTLCGIACALGLHGLRVSEVTRALSRHFSPINRTLYVCPYDPISGDCRPLKHGVARTVALHQTVVDAIEEWRDGLPDSKRSGTWLFPTRNGSPQKSQKLSAAGREMLVRLGCMDDKTTRFHMLRHTCAMRILSDTNDIQLVSKHLGHSSIKTTMTYLDCLKEVPQSCLVKLFETPSQVVKRNPQLTLFNPFEFSAG